MAVAQLTFLAPNPGAQYQTRSGSFTADNNGFISGTGLPLGAIQDLMSSGCVPCVASPYASFRNILDGGDFTVNPFQRNIAGIATSNQLAAALTATTPTYFADRFFGSSTGTTSLNMQITADTTVPGFNQSVLHYRSTGSGVSPLLFGQVLEPFDVIKCQGQMVTFSFWARTAANYSGGALTVQIISGTGNLANSTAANMIAAAWTGQANVLSTTQALTTSMTRYSFTGIVPVGALELGVLLSWTPTGSAGAADGIYFGGLQFEIGGLSPFEHRDAQVELEICQRYAWSVAEPGAGVVVGAGMNTTSAIQIFYMAAPVQFRAAPTVSVAAGTFKTNQASTATATTITAGTTHTVNAISINGNSAGTAGQGTLLQGGGGSGYILASSDF